MLNEHFGRSLFGPTRVAVLCSHRAPALDEILADPLHGSSFEVACVVTSESDFVASGAVEAAGVPVYRHPIRRFHREMGASLRDARARRAYDGLTVHVLEQLHVDVVLLLGYLYVVTDVVITPFAGRIFNIHDSDLTITGPDGERRYVGLHSTRDAVFAGEAETRSTLHLVTPKLDGGPVVLRSRAYPVAPFARDAAGAGHADIVKAYAYAQREWMMRHCWAEMAVRVLDAIGEHAHHGVRTEADAEVAAELELMLVDAS